MANKADGMSFDTEIITPEVAAALEEGTITPEVAAAVEDGSITPEVAVAVGEGVITPEIAAAVGEGIITPEVAVAGQAEAPLAPIIAEPAVLKRIDRQSSFEVIAGNGTVSAAVMVLAALLAVIVANSPIHELVERVLRAHLEMSIGGYSQWISFEAFVNDFLMAIFFMLVGIELKYEMTVGQLRRPRQAALPMLAAVGGVAVPALIYLAFNYGRPALTGWAIPIATDIAFALGVMSLLGSRVAPETKVFFQTLAIADDLLAIIVLALFYGQSLHISWCAASLVFILILAVLNGAHVYSAKPYMFVGLLLWVCMYNSGIHATLAGVIIAFSLPARSDVHLSYLRDWLSDQAREMEDTYDESIHVLGQHEFTESAWQVERIMHHVTPPLERVERNITHIVNYGILPLFAFVNAQVRLVDASAIEIISSTISQGAFLGAVLGKPIGIIAVTFLLVKIGFAKLPPHVTRAQVAAVGIMGGMGFTMSILISGLAFSDPSDVLAAKCAILFGSVVAGVAGLVFVVVHDAVRERQAMSRERDRS